MLQDWFYVTHSEAKADRPEFMGADQASTENKVFFGVLTLLAVLIASPDPNRKEMGHRGGWAGHLVITGRRQSLDPRAYRKIE